MVSGTTVAGAAPVGVGLLDRERIVAKPGFNRWLVPPAALWPSISASAWPTASRCSGCRCRAAIGVDAAGLPGPDACPPSCSPPPATGASPTWAGCTPCSSSLLGVAAALFGGWLERAGPRKAGLVSALCWCGGLVLAAIGIYTHQLWMMWLGSGVIGGIGLGLGYISPVSTLVKWFPDRRGMATGMAIMGFGGGAMIGAPLADMLMNYFKTPTAVGVWQTFLAMGAIYFVFMMIGAFALSDHAAGLAPGRLDAAGEAEGDDHASTCASRQMRTRPTQFWLIWGVLCLNVSAGIGVIGMASPMLQEIFAGRLIGLPDLGFAAARRPSRKPQIAAIAAGFAGLLSLFNIGGRFFWASLSDKIGRKNTYYTFFVLGIVLYALAPPSRRYGIASCCSCSPSASSCRCTAAASRPCRPISPTCSARSSSARSTAGC